jgi:hypothetical protein
MTYRFYVTVSLEAEHDHAVAEIGYRGSDIAAVTRVGDEWVATLYADGSREVPFVGLLGALEEAADRLQVDLDTSEDR